jgi:hypothetical protein
MITDTDRMNWLEKYGATPICSRDAIDAAMAKAGFAPEGSVAHGLKVGDRWGAYWLHADGMMRLYPPCECENGIVRSLGRDNDETVSDCPKCAPDEKAYLKRRVGELRIALAEIASEASGALNNAFPDEAPDVLANVAGIARRALSSPNVTDQP